MQAAFKSVMYDQNYVDARLKRYRIFMFCYMFGCIHANDLYYVFFKEDYGLDLRKHSENVNAWNALLTYLCKQGYLNRMEKGYCHLKPEGIESLYEHLCSLRMIDNVDFLTFKKGCRIRQSRVASHSAKSGRTVLSIARSSNTLFYVEPFIGLNGIMSFNSVEAENQFVFIPDALICNKECGESYFIEADSCSERIPSVIMPKFSSYADFLESEGISPGSCSILFSVWNDADKDSVLYDFYEYAEFVSLYDFIETTSDITLDFNRYMDSLKSYFGNNESLLKLSSFLNEGDFSQVMCKEDFLCVFKKYRLGSVFTSKYLLRRNQIQSCIEKIKKFRNRIFEGTRFVCLPSNTFYYLYDYIFLERESALVLCQNLIYKYFPEHQIVSYEKTASFKDPRSGETFVFRNVFVLRKDGQIIYVCMENISDDLSGRIRIKKYINFNRKSIFKDLFFICLYNDYFDQNHPDLLKHRTDLESYISFVPYSHYSPA